LDIRAALRNAGDASQTCEASFYLDRESAQCLLRRETIEVPAHSAVGVQFRWPPRDHTGKHHVILAAESGRHIFRAAQPVEILASACQSTRRLGGAWVDLYHHSEGEGRPFNDDLAKMTDRQWRELVRAMHAIDQDILVITMMFQNYTHRGKHRIEAEGYQGKASYPSKLFPGRIPAASRDPLEVILSEADRLGMHVLPGVGLYAFLDYSPAALEWHQKVASELWERYGHHPSFYGWYVSGEKDGSLGSEEERAEIISFFRQFTPYVRQLAPDKPVMLAPNCFRLRRAANAYRQLLPHLDIICPFGFHHMPPGDLSSEQAAALMQSWCQEAGTHLWMDLESFVFQNGKELHPRPIEGLISDFTRFPSFEKTLHYQFPGLMSAPAMSRQPGGPASVKLYVDYQRYLKGLTAPPSK